MTYLERYLNGEHEQVWDDLCALGSAVGHEPYAADALAVAIETMRRVQRNCARIVVRLQALGYIFGIYPDGTQGYYTDGPLVAPNDTTRSDYTTLHAQLGPIPLSLTAFWQEVGAVDLVGRHPAWPQVVDPLVVYAPEAALVDLDEWDEEQTASRQITVALAPDDLHKANISGGEPYSVALPNASADFVVLYERHKLSFVPYLRLALLKWGGFPGWEKQPMPFEARTDLVANLEPF
jgi:hypothetical protein